jgi:chromosome segregation ATPase
VIVALVLLTLVLGAVALHAGREKQRADRLDRALSNRLTDIGKLGQRVFQFRRETAWLRDDLRACEAQRDAVQAELARLRAEFREAAGVWTRPDGTRLLVQPEGADAQAELLRDLPTDGRRH